MMIRLLFAVLLAAAIPVRADDAPLPPLTPKGEYLVLTANKETTTSHCIGDPKTPMCAVETLLACFVRNKNDLCQTAMGVPWDRVPDFNRDLPWPPIVYRVVRREVLTDKHFPWRVKRDLEWRPGEPSVKAGDVRIDIVVRECDTKVLPEPCDPAEGASAYIVRQQNYNWAVVNWGPADDSHY
jgi:hypothetical protein